MRDYSKLRPLDLTKAQVGDQVIQGRDRAKVIGTSSWGAATEFEDGSFGAYHLSSISHLRQAPLAWLGPDPVYAGDTLYVHMESSPQYGRDFRVEAVTPKGLRISDGTHLLLNGDELIYHEVWSLTEPAPRHIEINGHKVPAPESTPPKYRAQYYVPAITHEEPALLYFWDNDETDRRCLERGLVHLTKEAAIAHAKALLSFKADHKKE